MKLYRFYTEHEDPYLEISFCFDYDNPYQLKDKFLNMEDHMFKNLILLTKYCYINNSQRCLDVYPFKNCYVDDNLKVHFFNWICNIYNHGKEEIV